MRITIELPDGVKGLKYVQKDEKGYDEEKDVTFEMIKSVEEDQNNDVH